MGNKTKYTFLTDIDILPNTGLAKDLSSFLKQNHCNKCAYVITPYELDSSCPFPESKKALKQLISCKKARLYHSRIFSANQHATNVGL